VVLEQGGGGGGGGGGGAVRLPGWLHTNGLQEEKTVHHP